MTATSERPDADRLFGVYVHWPFCAQKCPYCDFNSHVRFGGWDEARFLAAYLRELDNVAARISQGAPVLSPPPREETSRFLSPPPSGDGSGVLPLSPPPCGEGLGVGVNARSAAASPRASPAVTSIFFGGGTPSLMQPSTVAAILDHIAKLWPIDPGAEITLEANPNSVEANRFAGYRSAGVNRVSIGVQSLRDEELKRLGRLHSVAEARTAIDIARRTFDRFTFDLIYARPGQTLDAWRTELTEALAMAGGHLSLYQLTIEPDTPFADLHARGKLVIPDADAALDLYALTQDMTAAAGLPAYEISNHAAPGQESRHNLLYWRYGAYAGIGPGAHGRLVLPGGTRLATATERNPERWAGLVEAQGHGFTEETALSREEQADEMLLMGLRLAEGIDLESMARRFGFAPAASEIADLERMGLIEVLDDPARDPDIIRGCVGPAVSHVAPTAYAPRQPTIRAVGEGRFVLNELVRRLSLKTGPVPVTGNAPATLAT